MIIREMDWQVSIQEMVAETGSSRPVEAIERGNDTTLTPDISLSAPVITGTTTAEIDLTAGGTTTEESEA